MAWTIDKNNQRLGEAGVVGPLVEVLKTHWQSAAVMENACWALSNIADDGEWENMRCEHLRAGLVSNEGL